MLSHLKTKSKEKSLVHNLGSGGSDSPDGDVFKSDADPTLTFVLPAALSAEAQTVRPHYHLPCLPSHKVLGNFLSKKSSIHHFLPLQIFGTQGLFLSFQLFSQMKYKLVLLFKLSVWIVSEPFLFHPYVCALHFLQKSGHVILRLSVMSMRHNIHYKRLLSICFCGSSCVLSVRVSHHPFVWLCALPGSQDH